MAEQKARRVTRGGLGGNTNQNTPKVKKTCPFAKAKADLQNQNGL